MGSQKRAKARGGADPAPLDPEARARLESQVAGVMRALETEVEPAALMTLVTPDGGDPDWDAHLMAALGGLSHPAIPPLLAALFGRARDKVRRKALKKTLHRLQTRGVAVSADLLPREEASFGVPRPGAAKVFVSPIFGAGESYVILEAPPEVLGGNFLVARVSDQEGFKECVLLSLKRQQQAEVWGRFREQGLDEWFSPPPAYAVALLEEAYTRQATAPGAAQYGALREKIFQHWGRAEAAPDLDRELPAPAPGERPRLLERCRELALDPLFHLLSAGAGGNCPLADETPGGGGQPPGVVGPAEAGPPRRGAGGGHPGPLPGGDPGRLGPAPPDHGLLPASHRQGGGRPGYPGGGGRPGRPGPERPHRGKPFPEKPGAVYGAPGLGDAAAPGTRDAIRPGGSTR